MGMSPFLPGLILALAVWIVPFLFRFLPAQSVQPIKERYPWIAPLTPWIYNLGLPYLGLLLGWISARDFGVIGHTFAEWGIGAAAAILLGWLLAWVSVRYSNSRGSGDVLDEARWSLYRAAAWPWLNFLSLAVVVGFLASLAEYAFNGSRVGKRLSGRDVIPFLVRAAGSGALFLLAHNFFLAMLYYLIAYSASRPGVYARLERIYFSTISVISKNR
jgi:hypothetical protein